MGSKISLLIIFCLLFAALSFGNNNTHFSNNIIEEIKNTQDKVLVFQGMIGDRYVMYWGHRVNDVWIEGDYILLHMNKDKKNIIEYEKYWRNVNISINITKPFELPNYFWKKEVIFLNKTDCGDFYNFSVNVTYLLLAGK